MMQRKSEVEKPEKLTVDTAFRAAKIEQPQQQKEDSLAAVTEQAECSFFPPCLNNRELSRAVEQRWALGKNGEVG